MLIIQLRSRQLTSSQNEQTLLRSVKLPVTLQTDEVREQLAKPDLGESVTDDEMLLHTAHCCTLSHRQSSSHTKYNETSKAPKKNQQAH